MNGIPIKALLDTGATGSSVHPEVINKIIEKQAVLRRKVHGNIKVADGNTMKFEETAILNIKVPDCDPVDYEFIIFPFDGLQMIIGYDFMREFNAKLDVQKTSFHISLGKENENNSSDDESGKYEEEVMRMSQTEVKEPPVKCNRRTLKLQ